MSCAVGHRWARHDDHGWDRGLASCPSVPLAGRTVAGMSRLRLPVRRSQAAALVGLPTVLGLRQALPGELDRRPHRALAPAATCVHHGRMKPKQPTFSWGKPSAFVEWAACLALLCLGVAYHSNWINGGLMILFAALLLAGSLSVVWRFLKRNPGDATSTSQTGGLPRRLRMWMLGESDRDDR